MKIFDKNTFLGAYVLAITTAITIKVIDLAFVWIKSYNNSFYMDKEEDLSFTMDNGENLSSVPSSVSTVMPDLSTIVLILFIIAIPAGLYVSYKLFKK